MNKIFKKRLKEIRKRKSLTQNEFCEKIGITQATLSAYENGKKIPNTETILKIAKVFNVSIDWLFGLSDKPTLEIQTISDVLRLLMEMERAVLCTISVGESNKTVLSINNESIAEFVTNWQKMKILIDQKLIDQEFFDFWLEKTLKKTDVSISK